MSTGSTNADNTYVRPDLAQVKGRVPKASADLFSWAVHVAGMVTEPGRRPPSQNTCVIAALEDWAVAVLANHPGVAEAGISRLTQDPNFGAQDRAELSDLLQRLELDDLVVVVDPDRATVDEAPRTR